MNLSTIAALLGLSENLAGVTFLAFGNGSPDVFSTFAAMSTHSGSLAVGELIGAAGFITAVVSGSMALVRPFEVARAGFIRDVVLFICAPVLAMAFLLDGQLLMWECVLMIAFYLMYVVVVVAWHWISGRRTARKIQEATARQQFSSLTEDHVEQNINRIVGARNGSLADTSHLSPDEQFHLLEMAGHDGDEAGEDDRSRKHALSEISQNMRVNRSRLGARRTTRSTIRPSLVGALEFRAVLSSLAKSRSQQAIPISLRRYSDDPTMRPFHHRNLSTPGQTRTEGDRPAGRSPEQNHLSPHNHEPGTARGRNRAASANDIPALQSSVAGQDASLDIQVPGPRTQDHQLLPSLQAHSEDQSLAQSDILLSTDPQYSTPSSWEDEEFRGLDQTALGVTTTAHLSLVDDPRSSEEPRPGISRRVSSGLLLNPVTASSSPMSPFPQYHDDPLASDRSSRTSSFKLPGAIMGIDLNTTDDDPSARPTKLISWWPYGMIPPPQVLLSTLFPTIYSWPERNAWERLIGIVAAPSVFVLTITLPVVEEKMADEASEYEATTSVDYAEPASPQSAPNPPLISIEGPSETDSSTSIAEGARTSASVPATAGPSALDISPLNSPVVPSPSTQGWNRWLVCTQIIMGPLFVTLILWANVDTELSVRTLALYEAYAMVGALTILAFMLYATTADAPPRFRPVLSFAGFVVSVAWISTIANEVVGVLKAFGVIFGISDAILGLTIFAVGNR